MVQLLSRHQDEGRLGAAIQITDKIDMKGYIKGGTHACCFTTSAYVHMFVIHLQIFRIYM